MPKLPQILMPKMHWPASFMRTRIAFALKIATLLAVTVTVFHQDLVLIFSDAFQNETRSYILAVPFILTYLIYRKRKMLRTVMPLDSQQPRNTRHVASLSGLLLAATAVLLYWHGSYTITPPEYYLFALPLFTAGLILILFNPQTLRQLAFPVIFLFFLMPPPSEILNITGSNLQVIGAQASNAIINAFNIPSTLTMDNGNLVITLTRPSGATLSYMVNIASSGIYSLIGLTVFAITIAYVIRDKLWKKAALIMVGIPLVYLLNIVRITTMLFAGYNLGDDLALQSFQLLGGFVLIFIGTLVLLLISEKAFKTQILSKTPVKCVQCNPEPQPGRDYCKGCGRIFHPATAKLRKTDLAKVAAIILVVGILVTIEAPVFGITRGASTITFDTISKQQYSANILLQTSQYTLAFQYEDHQLEHKLALDLALVYLYKPFNESARARVYVSFEIAPFLSSLPSWKTTSTHAPIDVPSDPQLRNNPSIFGHYFAFNYTATNGIQLVLYWYTLSVFVINQTAQLKNVEISLISYPSSMDELPTVEQQLLTLATTIANYWQPIQTWSEAAFLISQYGITLSIVTSAGLLATLLYYTAETRRQRKTSLKAASKLGTLSIAIVSAVQKTRKPATLENLASTLQKNTGQTIAMEQLAQRLMELENAGIIKSQIYSQNDTPVQTWKM